MVIRFLCDVENKIKRTIKVKRLMNECSYLLLITLFFISDKVTLVGTEWQFGWALLNISCDGCLYEPREVYGRKNETIHYPTTDSPIISITDTIDVSRDSARVTISFPEHWNYKLVTAEEVDKVEIRGEVYDNLTNHKPNATGKGAASWNSYNFAGFFYDFDTGFSSETLTVESASGRSIGENELVYESRPIKEILCCL